jgi:hypothetical protein
MRIADLTTGAAKLSSAWKILQIRWEDTKEHWHDANYQRFEETYIDPLEPQIAATIEAIGRLAEVMARAERDCE